MLVDACSVDELQEGKPTVVKVKGREIAVVQWRGEVHAVRNICPHQTQSFATGHVRSGFAAGEGAIGELTVDGGEPVLVCPVHTWAFNLRSGKCVVDERLRVRRYDTAIEDGRLLIDIS
ncbi:MAG: Rieske (2Fe-2S) protein [Candidatus Dormibacteria bacterium]